VSGATGTAKQHRTVTRVVRIIEIVAAAGEPVRLAALAAALGAPKTSVHGLAQGLVATGYLTETPTGYLLGPAVSSLVGPAEPDVIAAARPVMERLRREFDETVILSTQVGLSVVYLDTVESAQLIRYAAPLRQRRPVYPTSTGKCFLADLPSDRRDAILTAFVHDPAALATARAELDLARDEGVAYNHYETVPDVSAAASLVRVPGRNPVAIAVVGPSGRVEPALPQIAESVRTAAAEITAALPRLTP